MEILVIVVAGIAMLWLMTRSTRKQQRAQIEMRNTLAPGDEVMTGAGLYGTVVSADGDVIVLETSPGVEQRWARGAIMRKVEPGPPDELDSREIQDAEPEIDETEIDETEIDEFEVPDDPSGLDPDNKKS